MCLEELLKHLRYVNFELDDARHSTKKCTIKTYYHLQRKYGVHGDNQAIGDVLDEYARNSPLKFVALMYKVGDLEVSLVANAYSAGK